MSAISEPVGRRDTAAVSHTDGIDRSRRLSTETKSAFKTTEFIAYVVVLVGIMVAGLLTKAGHYGGHHDPFRADKVWLYATILTVGYMVSRGIAKAGSHQPYDEKS